MSTRKHIIELPNVEKVGVYAIHNKITDRYYVGSSVNIKNRLATHRRNIEKLNGVNLKMDEDLKTKKDIKNFEFLILETFKDYTITETTLRRKEYEYIKILNAEQSGYNYGQYPGLTGYFKKNELLRSKKENEFETILCSLPRGTVNRIESLGLNPTDFIQDCILGKLDA